MPFIDFKRSLRSFEENERAANQYNKSNDATIMRCDENHRKETNYWRDGNNYSRGGGQISSNQYSRDTEYNQVEDRGEGASTNYIRNNDRRTQNKQLICFVCDGKGHRAHECPTKRNQQNGNNNERGGRGTGRNKNNNQRESNNRDRTWCAREQNERYEDNEHSFHMYVKEISEEGEICNESEKNCTMVNNFATKHKERKEIREEDDLSEEWDMSLEEIIEETKTVQANNIPNNEEKVKKKESEPKSNSTLLQQQLLKLMRKSN